jgi:hypothetical protein
MVPLNDTPSGSQPQGGGHAKRPTAMATKEVRTTRGQANNTNTIAREVNMHHLALGSPTHATFFRAIEKGWSTGFPNLTLENAKLHYPWTPKTHQTEH